MPTRSHLVRCSNETLYDLNRTLLMDIKLLAVRKPRRWPTQRPTRRGRGLLWPTAQQRRRLRGKALGFLFKPDWLVGHDASHALILRVL